MAPEMPVVNLEDETPAAPAAMPAEPAAPAPAEPAPVATSTMPEPELDPNAVDLKDEARVRGLLAELSRQRGAVRDLKAKAERADQLEGWVNQAKPYVDFLQANPDLLKPRAAPAAPTPSPATDPKLVQFAQALDLYDAQAQPDTKKAALILSMMEERAEATAQAAVAPLQKQTASQQSAANYRQVLAFKTPDGKSPSKEAVDALWRSLPPESTADPNVAMFVTLAALGSQVAGAAPTVPAPLQPPVVTEASGGVTRPRTTMSDLEQAVARQRGTDPEKWQKLVKGHNTGRPSTLEE